MTSREPKSDPKAPPRLPYPATTDWAETAGDVHKQPPAETHQPLSRGSVPQFAEGRSIHADGLRARWERWLADTEEGSEICRLWKKWVAPRSKSTNGTSILTTPTIRPFTGLRGTGIWRALSRAKTSTRSPTTLACRARTSILHELPRPDEGRSRWPKADWLVTGGLDHERRPGYRSAANSPGLQLWPRLQNFRKNL